MIELIGIAVLVIVFISVANALKDVTFTAFLALIAIAVYAWLCTPVGAMVTDFLLSV